MRRNAAGFALLLSVFCVASAPGVSGAQAAQGHRTRARSSQAAHSARKKNEGAAAASAEQRRVEQAQRTRNARQKMESDQKRARDGKLRKEAAAQKKKAEKAAAAATAKQNAVDRKFKREEQARKSKIESQRRAKLAADLKAAKEEEERQREVAEREAEKYEERRKEVASAVEERQKLIAVANSLQKHRRRNSGLNGPDKHVSRRQPAVDAAQASGSARASTDVSRPTFEISGGPLDDVGATDAVAPSGYCDRDGICEGKKDGGGSNVGVQTGAWLADDGKTDSVQTRLANEARERTVQSDMAQKYLKARQAKADAKANERKRREAAAAGNNDGPRAERKAAAHAAAAAATAAAKMASAAAKHKQMSGGTESQKKPSLPSTTATTATATGKRRRSKHSTREPSKTMADSAYKARLQAAKEKRDADIKKVAEIMAAKAAEATIASTSTAADVEELCAVEIPNFAEVPVCSCHADCGALGYCRSDLRCADRRQCTHSPGFPEATPVDAGCPPTTVEAYTTPCNRGATAGAHPQQGTVKPRDQAVSVKGNLNMDGEFSIASLATKGGASGQSKDGILTIDMVPGPSVREVEVTLRDGHIVKISFTFIDSSQASWEPATAAKTPASKTVKVREGVQKFPISPGHYITRIKVTVGTTLAGFQMVTSDGQSSPWFGGFDGRRKTFSAPVQCEIWALNRNEVVSNPVLFNDVKTRSIAAAFL